jgi:hypothetical protein
VKAPCPALSGCAIPFAAACVAPSFVGQPRAPFWELQNHEFRTKNQPQTTIVHRPPSTHPFSPSSFVLSAAADGSVITEPSGKMIVGTLRKPPLTRST